MKRQTQKTKTIALMGILIAIMLLMSFTPIGYFKYGTVSISLLMIPVAIGAVALGPWAGAVLGGVFGITSFAQCFGGDAFGTFLMDINPFATFVMCIVARILAGLCAGLVAAAFRNRKKTLVRLVGYFVTGLSAALFNTLFFMGSLLLFFWNSQTFINAVNEWGFKTENILLFFFAFVGINCVFELIVTCIVTGAIGEALEKASLIAKGTLKPAYVIEKASGVVYKVDDAKEEAKEAAEVAEEAKETVEEAAEAAAE